MGYNAAGLQRDGVDWHNAVNVEIFSVLLEMMKGSSLDYFTCLRNISSRLSKQDIFLTK